MNCMMNGLNKATLIDLLLVYSIMLVTDGADGVLNKEHFSLGSKGGNFDKDCYKNFKKAVS